MAGKNTRLGSSGNVRQGVYDYNDNVTPTTPIAITAAGGFTLLTNDKLGPQTNTTYALAGVPNLFGTAGHTNQFDWTGLKTGDTVDIRVDVEITTTSPNQLVEIQLKVAVGEAGEYTLPWGHAIQFKSSGVQRIVYWSSLYMGDVNTQANPSQFEIKSDGNADVKVNGWYLRALKSD